MNTPTTALVTAAGISFDDGKTHSIERDSEEWRQWFTITPEGSKIRFEWLNSYLHRNTYTAYRRKRYWEAQKRVDGKLRNTTIKPEEATYQKLEQVGSELTAYNWDRAEQKHQHKSGSNEIYQTSNQTSLQVAEIEELKQQLKEYKHRCTHLENENNRLTRLGQDYSQATVGRLSEKYTKALKDIEHWKQSTESYKRQALKLRTELEQLQEEMDNQSSNAIANFEHRLRQETQRANEAVHDGLKAATILHQALKLKPNAGGAIKAKIKEALKLIDDI